MRALIAAYARCNRSVTLSSSKRDTSVHAANRFDGLTVTVLRDLHCTLPMLCLAERVEARYCSMHAADDECARIASTCPPHGSEGAEGFATPKRLREGEGSSNAIRFDDLQAHLSWPARYRSPSPLTPSAGSGGEGDSAEARAVIGAKARCNDECTRIASAPHRPSDAVEGLALSGNRSTASRCAGHGGPAPLARSCRPAVQAARPLRRSQGW